ncbi:MAG: hypothetical protein IJ565_02725 [Bacilli bacterium]|nr:hypothetical protein [Bacilli bacterium]
MKIIEADTVTPYILNSLPIGVGTTAICFCLLDGRVFKYYINTRQTMLMFANPHFKAKLERISTITNDSYVGPQELLFIKGELKGYFYPYVEGKTLKSTRKDITLSELFRNYEKLLTDTIEVSKKGFTLYDLHDRNIIFNDYFNIIDLDRCYFENDKFEHTLRINLRTISETILGYIFKTEPWQTINIYDRDLQYIYYNTDWQNLDEVDALIKMISDKCNDADPTVKTIRKKIKYVKEYNEYYR